MSGVIDPATGQPISEGAPAPDTNTTPPPVFTQEQVNSVAAKEKREGRKALATELETLTGFTLEELKALKKTQTAQQPPATPAPASPAPQGSSDEVLQLVRAMAAKQEALEAKLTATEAQKAKEALEAKAKTSGVWDQFMDVITTEEAIQATLDKQKAILEQHGGGTSAKKPAPTTFGGASSSVRDVATNDELSLEDAQKRLKDLGGI